MKMNIWRRIGKGKESLLISSQMVWMNESWQLVVMTYEEVLRRHVLLANTSHGLLWTGKCSSGSSIPTLGAAVEENFTPIE